MIMSSHAWQQIGILEDDSENNIKVINEDWDEEYYKSLLPIKISPVFNTYWKFAHKRQSVFFNRLSGANYPWTNDQILKKYKFTNAYRASDRVSQYLIKKVIYSGPKDPLNLFFRIMLFKLFNKIETWELIENKVGEIRYENYSFSKYNKLLDRALDEKKIIYSAAYIMPSGRIAINCTRKHSHHLKLIEMMINDKVYEKIQNAKRFQNVFEILIDYPMIGPFLGYQFSIDLNYSELINFSENDFVIPGPGALSGISKCFTDRGGLTEIEIIKFMQNRQKFEFQRLGLPFQSLWGRDLQLIDCQNLFCEVDKYSRVAHPNFQGISKRNKIKQIFRAKNDKINFWYPPKWGINEKIEKQL